MTTELTDITKQEQGIIAMCRLNKLTAIKKIEKDFKIRGLKINFLWQSKDNLWGRFGGGWNINFGFQASKSTTIINLFTFSLRFSRETK